MLNKEKNKGPLVFILVGVDSSDPGKESREGEFLLLFFHPVRDREVRGMNHPLVLDTFQKYAFLFFFNIFLG